MPSVLVLGGRAPVALDHARRFRRQGWTVHVGDSAPCRLSGWSNAVVSTIALPSPNGAPEAFAQALAAAVRTHAIDLVLPTCEEVFHVARHRAALPAHVRVPVPALDLLRALHSKWAFQALVRAAGARVPDGARVATLAQARAWAGDVPVVIKPEFSRFGTHVRLYPRGIPAAAPELGEHGAWVVQRYVVGEELCSYSVAERGRLLAHVAYRPLHRLGASASYYFEAVEAPAIRAVVETLVRQLDYTGQVAFDWIDDDGGGAPVALECNPRSVSGVHLFADDDPLPAALAGTQREPFAATRARPAMLGPVMFGAGLRRAVAEGNVGAWWRDWRRADDVLARAGDRKPLLGGLADMVSFARLARAAGLSLREASTHDIEWDGEAPA
jgi:predicted ATP-grasp superfamily ATP-dependent carboligase